MKGSLFIVAGTLIIAWILCFFVLHLFSYEVHFLLILAIIITASNLMRGLKDKPAY